MNFSVVSPLRTEADLRLLLRTEGELVAVDSQLTEQLAEGRSFYARRHVSGQRMQADVELATGEAVEAVQATRGIVPLEDADLLPEMRQPDARREA